ncbi:MAG: hypothetical protein IBX46_05790 [Desulfuromonadales bacterium]|nr:hypothetical protein [Desulfuromonadales bacterium]
MMSKRLLGFLIPAFIASLIYGYLQMPKQERITSGEQRSQSKMQQASRDNNGYPRLRSDLIDRKSQPYPGVRRNLFGNSQRVVEEIEVYIEEPPPVIVPPVVITPPPPPPPSPQEIARKELSRYKFVGFFKKGEKQTIFLATDGEVLLVRKGEYIGRDRKYYVVNITDTEMELRKEGAGDFSIKLTDQESLSAIPRPSSPPSGPTGQPQEAYRLDQPEFLVIPDEETQTGEQFQPDEANNETQN